MADPATNGAEAEEELVDYEEEEIADTTDGAKGGEQVKKGYVGIHSSGFKVRRTCPSDCLTQQLKQLLPRCWLAAQPASVTVSNDASATPSLQDFLLKPELLRAIVDCGFEHPSEGETSKIRRKLVL